GFLLWLLQDRLLGVPLLRTGAKGSAWKVPRRWTGAATLPRVRAKGWTSTKKGPSHEEARSKHIIGQHRRSRHRMGSAHDLHVGDRAVLLSLRVREGPPEQCLHIG